MKKILLSMSLFSTLAVASDRSDIYEVIFNANNYKVSVCRRPQKTIETMNSEWIIVNSVAWDENSRFLKISTCDVADNILISTISANQRSYVATEMKAFFLALTTQKECQYNNVIIWLSNEFRAEDPLIKTLQTYKFYPDTSAQSFINNQTGKSFFKPSSVQQLKASVQDITQALKSS
jgi:hypothetical protein